LLLLVWFGNFSESHRFSLYADDWGYFGWEGRMSWSFGDWFSGIILYSAGRPIQWSLTYLAGTCIDHFKSIEVAYILLFVITAASVLAMWWVLSHRFTNSIALVAAAVFAISPLVSIRPFVNGIASPAAILFLMVSGALYVSGRRVLSYFCAALVLLSYELVFPLFVFLPALLTPLVSRRDVYRLLGHAAICAAMLAGFAFSMRFYGGDRLSGALAGRGVLDVSLALIRTAVLSLPLGLAGSVDLPLWVDKIRSMPGVVAWIVPAFGAFAFLLQRFPAAAAEDGREGRWVSVQTLGILLLMAMAGYALAYFALYGGDVAVLGRQSRLQSAANLPLSILTAMGLAALIGIARPGWPRHSATLAAAGYLALIFAFSVSHQQDFAQATARQRQAVLQLAIDHPLMDPQATFIIRFQHLDNRHLPAIEYEDYHSWYALLGFLLKFPDASMSKMGPTIKIVHSDYWMKGLTVDAAGKVQWPAGQGGPGPDLAGHIWFYEFTLDGKLIPRQAPILVAGRNILHEGPDAAEGGVDLGKLTRPPLFDMVMGRDAAVFDAIVESATARRAAPDVATGN
jgi:hypothetical protein